MIKLFSVLSKCYFNKVRFLQIFPIKNNDCFVHMKQYCPLWSCGCGGWKQDCSCLSWTTTPIPSNTHWAEELIEWRTDPPQVCEGKVSQDISSCSTGSVLADNSCAIKKTSLSVTNFACSFLENYLFVLGAGLNALILSIHSASAIFKFSTVEQIKGVFLHLNIQCNHPKSCHEYFYFTLV